MVQMNIEAKSETAQSKKIDSETFWRCTNFSAISLSTPTKDQEEERRVS